MPLIDLRQPRARSTLAYIRAEISALRPGQCICISRHLFMEGETDLDEVMGGLIGASYDILPTHGPAGITFRRLDQPLDDGRLAWVYPDRREHYRYDGRFWIPKEA